MDDSGEQLLKCPVAEAECRWLDEIAKLRLRVSELTELVSTDALTGLYNFQHFKSLLQVEMDRAKRSGIPTTLVMIDLDHFNQVNHKYGYEAGNLALSHVAAIIKNEVRTTDCACRYAGGEFAIVFPQTHLNLALKVADRIREIIADSPVRYDQGKFNITVSMGASVYMKTSIIGLDTFVDSVDNYLYEAKQSGRNCICHIDYSDLSKVTEIGVDERARLSSKNSGKAKSR
jgi:diguanylate cyclase (GGDEF)-like protein